jgi:type I restriction enzyme S subunit
MRFDLVATTLPMIAAEVRNAIVGGPFGSNLVSRDYVDSGVPVIRGQNMGPGKYIGGEYVFVTEEKADKLKANLARPNDLVFTQRGTLGQVAIVPEGKWGRYVVSQSQMKVTVDPKKADVEFLFYYFSSPREVRYIQASAIQTGVPHTNLTQLKEHPIQLPSLSNQKSIANILGTLDEKIELNRQMNSTLESMAQALFKSWFVDFDPVIDNALKAGNPIPEPLQARAERRNALGDQRKPLPEHIQSQFPSSLMFSEVIGWVPEGWEIKPLGEYLSVLETGRRPKGGVAKYTDGIPSVGAESIKGIGRFEFGQTKYVPIEFFDAMKSGKVQDHDVLLYKDGGKPGDFKPRIGMFGNGFPFDSFGINEHVFRLRSETLDQPFLYFQASCDRVFHHLKVRGGKAAIPGINQTEVRSVDFLVPSAELLSQFNAFSYPIIDKILQNATSALNMAQLRDTLLPKLLSGELRIPDAEAQLSEAL